MPCVCDLQPASTIVRKWYTFRVGNNFPVFLPRFVVEFKRLCAVPCYH